MMDQRINFVAYVKVGAKLAHKIPPESQSVRQEVRRFIRSVPTSPVEIVKNKSSLRKTRLTSCYISHNVIHINIA